MKITDYSSMAMNIISNGWHLPLVNGKVNSSNIEDKIVKICNYLELKDRHVVAVNTGTSALHLAVELCDIQKDDEIIVPSFNFVADQVAIEMAGAKVVMCDIRDDNLGIDCKKAEELISDKTKAIIPVHLGGNICEMNKIKKIAKKYKINT